MPGCCLRSELNQERTKSSAPACQRIIRCLLPQLRVTLTLAVFGQVMTGDSNRKTSKNAGSDVTDNLTECEHKLGRFLTVLASKYAAASTQNQAFNAVIRLKSA